MFVADVKFVFQQQLHGRFFTGTWMALLSEFDAPARCTSTNKRERQQHGAADSRTALVVFLWELERSSHLI